MLFSLRFDLCYLYSIQYRNINIIQFLYVDQEYYNICIRHKSSDLNRDKKVTFSFNHSICFIRQKFVIVEKYFRPK